MLYSKQGRAQQFTTQAARDRFLNAEIKSLRAHGRIQQTRVVDLRSDVEGARNQLTEVVERAQVHSRTEVERRENLRRMGQEVSDLKATVDRMQEQRKSVIARDANRSCSRNAESFGGKTESWGRRSPMPVTNCRRPNVVCRG